MNTKIIRQIDKLGRLVIPIDLRKQYGIKAGDNVSIIAHEKGIVINLEDGFCNDKSRIKA